MVVVLGCRQSASRSDSYRYSDLLICVGLGAIVFLLSCFLVPGVVFVSIGVGAAR